VTITAFKSRSSVTQFQAHEENGAQ